MSAEYMQSAQRARALIEEIGAEKFGQDMSAKNTWLYEAEHQVEKVVKERFKTMEDQDQVMQVQVALEHTTTNEYMQGTLTNLADEGGTHEFTTSVKEIFTCIKSMILETWKTHQDLKKQLFANSQVHVAWDAANAMPTSAMNSGPTTSETSNQGQTTDMMAMMSMLLQNLTQ